MGSSANARNSVETRVQSVQVCSRVGCRQGRKSVIPGVPACLEVQEERLRLCPTKSLLVWILLLLNIFTLDVFPRSKPVFVRGLPNSLCFTFSVPLSTKNVSQGD